MSYIYIFFNLSLLLYFYCVFVALKKVYPTERTEAAKESSSSYSFLAQAGSVAEAHRPPPSSLRV